MGDQKEQVQTPHCATTGKQESRQGFCAGFTLIEVMISLLLIAVALISIAALFTSTIVANRKVRVESEVFQNISFALEDMSRKIREGTNHLITQGGKQIDIVVQGGDPFNPDDHITYRLNETTRTVERNAQGSGYLSMTASSVSVTNLSFSQLAYGGTVDDQPRFLITIGGFSSTTPKDVSSFHLQTQVAKRRQPPAVVAAGGSSSVPENPLCTFNTAIPNRYIVDMEHGKANFSFMVGAESSKPRETLGPYPTPTPIPAGWYSVKLVTFDDHCVPGTPPNCTVGLNGPNQINEQFYIRLNNSSGATIASSGYTSDIPNTENTIYPHEEVNTALFLSQPVHSITAVMAFFDAPAPSALNSVVPACAALDWLGSTSTVDILPF